MTMAHDRLQRLAALRREGILTDAEYEAKRSALIAEAIDGPVQLITGNGHRAGRDAGHVVRGFIFGLPLGIAAIVYTLAALPRGKKREDLLFGAWLGTATGGLMVIILLGALSMGGAKSSPENANAAANASGWDARWAATAEASIGFEGWVPSIHVLSGERLTPADEVFVNDFMGGCVADNPGQTSGCACTFTALIDFYTLEGTNRVGGLRTLWERYGDPYTPRFDAYARSECS